MKWRRIKTEKIGENQTGLNCEYDGLSEVILTLSHSSMGDGI